MEYRQIKFDYNISRYTNENILNLNPDDEYLFVVIVEINYPNKFQDRDFEFPILCEQSIPSNDQAKKLMSTL